MNRLPYKFPDNDNYLFFYTRFFRQRLPRSKILQVDFQGSRRVLSPRRFRKFQHSIGPRTFELQQKVLPGPWELLSCSLGLRTIIHIETICYNNNEYYYTRHFLPDVSSPLAAKGRGVDQALGKSQKNGLFLVARPLKGGGGVVRAWPLKKLNFFLFCSQSKIKHILFKGLFIGYRYTKLRLNMALLVQKLCVNFCCCQNPFSAILSSSQINPGLKRALDLKQKSIKTVGHNGTPLNSN